MSADLFVRGIVPADGKFQKMKAIWDACEAADVPLPKEVDEFFGGNEPLSSGMVKSINLEAKRKLSYEEGPGMDIDLRKLDPDIKIIRVSISY